jgi:secreted trypsin-like serine protease
LYEENTYTLVDTSLLPFENTYIRSYKCTQGTGLIVGGTDAEKGEFPYAAVLGYYINDEILWKCGGNLISENFVLTAGHCLKSQ